MVDKVYIDPLDEVYITVQSETQGVLLELNEYFRFKVKGAEFMPAFKHKVWDGYIPLYNTMNGRIYKGLLEHVIKFCQDRGFEVFINDKLKIDNQKITDIDAYCKSLKLKLEPYDYQKAAIKNSINNERITLLSPTSSGKTLTIYSIIRYYFERVPKKILMIVPRIDLVTQAISDFKSYSDAFDVEKNIHAIYAGEKKYTDKKIVISTYQSLQNVKQDYFDQFDVVIQDECHLMDAKTIKGIFEKARDIRYRIGCTGTLEDSKCHQLIIQGLLGPIFEVVRIKKLMDENKVSDLTVQCFKLKYSPNIIKLNKKLKYSEEIDFIVNYKPRNEFLAKLAIGCSNEKNVLVLTDFHDKREHIKLIKEEIERLNPNKIVLVVHGKIKPHDRDAIRRQIEKESGLIIIATYGVYSTGISINNIQNIIMATNSKSLIKILQSIGRGLRLDGKSNKVNVFDVTDDFSTSSKKNYLYQHFFERIRIYLNQQFKYQIKTINII